MLRNFIFSKALIGSVLVLTLFVCVLIADPEVFADEFFVLSKLGEHPKTADIFTFGLSIGAILYGLRILLLEKKHFWRLIQIFGLVILAVFNGADYHTMHYLGVILLFVGFPLGFFVYTLKSKKPFGLVLIPLVNIFLLFFLWILSPSLRIIAQLISIGFLTFYFLYLPENKYK